MTYEDQTYEVILARMMERVEAKYPDLDRREGSLIFDALSGCAMELAIAYYEMDNQVKESFMRTASREYLFIGCEEMGIDTSQFDATKGIHQASFNVPVEIGSRWNCDLFNFKVIEYVGELEQDQIYLVEAESAGSSPNNVTGDLTPITEAPQGLEKAVLLNVVIEGENEKSDEFIRDTYFNFVKSTASDGNVGQYDLWCDQYPGIGNHKIFPVWNGANTVKVSILATSNQPASPELVEEFQNYLDPNSEGMGNGKAPIGAVVTVTTASERKINLSGTIKFKQGYSDTEQINVAVRQYLQSVAYEKDVISYLNLASVVLAVEGVELLDNFLVDGGTDNVVLTSEQVATLGKGEWVVA